MLNTPQGRIVANKALKVATKVGKVYLKQNGIDLNAILSESDDESEQSSTTKTE